MVAPVTMPLSGISTQPVTAPHHRLDNCRDRERALEPADRRLDRVTVLAVARSRPSSASRDTTRPLAAVGSRTGHPNTRIEDGRERPRAITECLFGPLRDLRLTVG